MELSYMHEQYFRSVGFIMVANKPIQSLKTHTLLQEDVCMFTAYKMSGTYWKYRDACK